ncbi:arabinan endo-1,5-alpha-L-arabinosidase [Hymenobacter sp. DH14]|uniref:Arabinan endo-1,5-alpha-L-arabinosidase n=1 Tax=Hymenobacter cyanobacteriorum TaxID=2926463 RepID=A0A9X1VD52_9BACT|nr:arabinan endo-1,5-alpha-L-arabinosidase [Hymenobacter cyanobacteriorum]MCI1186706.1 arabinan endo-1,5-alpha-L-arabinosidase [Hymenobacter cyanobacteriorum]
MKKHVYRFVAAVQLLAVLGLGACKKEPTPAFVPTAQPPTTGAFDINTIKDTYPEVAPLASYRSWASYNVHDPAIIKDGDYYYCYSTDVGYGLSDAVLTPGLQVRRSKDLIQWEYVGWVFTTPPAMGSAFIRQNGGVPNRLLWAPYVIKVNNEFRLYYSLASDQFKLSVIGLATASSPLGPWTERGVVVTSTNLPATPVTNAIDPTVIIDQQGQHRMYYGSAFDGIYTLVLDPATGLAQTPGQRGQRIAQRGFTGNTINGNIEGPEVIYNSEQKKYYLFISYDWLFTKYNVRVGRSASAAGPFLDYNGRDINLTEDHGPMILAPYQFAGHGGWQGTAHCGVFENNGQFYMTHQGRPGVDAFYMDLHVRKIFWTPDGWPVVSPERYAGEDNTPSPQADLVGDWEQIKLSYRVTPGFGNEQTNPDFQVSTPLTLAADGTFNGNAANTWTYAAPWLEMRYSNGTVDKLYVQKGRDWENRKPTTVFTGLNGAGVAMWGKKK